MNRAPACLVIALVGAACSSSGRDAARPPVPAPMSTAPSPTTSAAASPAAAAPAPVPGEMYVAWVRPAPDKRGDAPPPYSVLLDENGRTIATVSGIWVAAGDEVWRIVRKKQDRAAHCADGTTRPGSSFELSANATAKPRTIELLPAGDDVVTHAARLDRTVGRYLFVSATDSSCTSGDTAPTQIFDVESGQALAAVDDAAQAAESALPSAVASSLAKLPSLGGVSHGAPNAAWRKAFGDPGLKEALMDAFDPDFERGDAMFTQCAGNCDVSLDAVTCDVAKGRCSIEVAGTPQPADAKPSAQLIAVLEFLDRADGKARCDARRCTLGDVSCDWPRDEPSQASCQAR